MLNVQVRRTGGGNRVKRAVWVIGAVMFLVPLLLLAYMSYLETGQYEQEVIKVVERSYGTPTPVERRTLREVIKVKGTFISDAGVFIDIGQGEVRALVSVEDEVQKGDALATVDGEEITAPCNGVVKELSAYAGGYIRLLNLEELSLECYVGESAVKLEQGKTYEADGGLTATLVSLSNIVEENGRRALFTVTGGSFLYGQSAEIEIYTGIQYEGVLTVEKACVYQKEAEGPYYVRRVRQNGEVIGESEVKVGISNGNMISITGAEEGWMCDPGYSKFMGA